MVDAPALGAGGAIRGGSSPLSGTKYKNTMRKHCVFIYFAPERGLEKVA